MIKKLSNFVLLKQRDLKKNPNFEVQHDINNDLQASSIDQIIHASLRLNEVFAVKIWIGIENLDITFSL